METNKTMLIGYFSSSTISFMHLQDIAMALVLGFFGAAGAYLFKRIFDRKKR
jgi:H+/Cl- antiporter ClcA